MNRWTVNVFQIGVAAVFAAGVSACNRSGDADAADSAALSSAANSGATDGVKYGRVVSVDPVRDPGGPKQVCHDVTVTHTTPPKDEHRIVGTAIGAVAGGLLGNQVGGGRGRSLATVAGAVGGGYAGNRIEASRQHAQVTSSVQHRCTTVEQPAGGVVAYDVRYEYKGVTRTVRMDHDPGDRVQVQEGVTAVSDAR